MHGSTIEIGGAAQDIASPFFAKTVPGIERSLGDTAYGPILPMHWHAEGQVRSAVQFARQIAPYTADTRKVFERRTQPRLTNAWVEEHSHNRRDDVVEQNANGAVAGERCDTELLRLPPCFKLLRPCRLCSSKQFVPR